MNTDDIDQLVYSLQIFEQLLIIHLPLGQLLFHLFCNLVDLRESKSNELAIFIVGLLEQ